MMKPTRYPNGVNNCRNNAGIYTSSEDELGEPSPIRYIRYQSEFVGAGPENDFMASSPVNHTVTKVGTGALSLAPPASGTTGGWLKILNSAASGDGFSIQTKDIPFVLSSTNEDWMVMTNFQVDDATNAALLIGLCNSTTTPLTATDGAWFVKASGATTLSAQVSKSSTVTTVGTTTLANATTVKVAMRFISRYQQIQFLVNDAVVATTTTLTNIPTVGLAPTIYMKNGTAAARTMYTDYYNAFSERY